MDMQTSLCLEDPLQLSFDGYVRITFDGLERLRFGHKSAWEDTSLAADLRIEAVPAVRAGYCEWQTQGQPVVTLGWAWFCDAHARWLVAPGGVSSNLMLVTPTRYDLGPRQTSELLRAWLSGIDWCPPAVRATF